MGGLSRSGRGRVLLSLVFLAVLALVATLLEVLPEEAASAASAVGIGIPATPVKRTAPTAPTGDFSDLGATLPVPTPVTSSDPIRFDASTASPVVRNEFSDITTDAHGMRRTVTSTLPVNVLSGGVWVPSSTTLGSLLGGSLGVALHPLAPVFGATADAASLEHVARDGATLDFRLEGASRTRAAHPVLPIGDVGADTVRYDDALPGVDLEYRVDHSSVTERMILSSAPTRGPTYSWIVTATGGITPATDATSGIAFAKADGAVVFAVPAPNMYDSSPKGGESGGDIVGVPWSISPSGVGQWRITLTPSADWLADAARVYPVTIDPTVNPSADGPIHSYKSDGYYNDGRALTGNNRQSGASCCNWRAIPHYNYEQLFGQQLSGAYLRLAYYSGQASGQGDCFTTNIYAAAAFSFYGAGQQMGSMPNCYSTATQSADIGGLINGWINARQASSYLFLIGDEAQWSYRASTTSIVLDSLPQPTMTGLTGPTNGVRAAVQPILQATSTDPTGGGLSYDYQFSTTSNFASVAYDSGRVGAGPYQVPAGSLSPGTTYYYRALVSDFNQRYGTWSPWQGPTTDASRYFVTNTPAPAVAQGGVWPTDKTVVSTLAPVFQAPAVSDGNGDPVRYQFRVATGADGNSGAVTTSGWLPTGITSWSVPVGTLQDGVAYTLQVLTNDGYDTTTPPWVTRFTENLRIGSSGPAPTDVAGPVTVNLANGNASLNFAGPTVSTMGGAMGMSFAYNSLVPSTQYQGLTASYYSAVSPGQTSTTTFDLAGKTALLTRTEPGVNFPSGTAPVASPVPATYFMGRWTGFVRTPATGGPYTFGTVTDDGSRLVLGGSQVINAWSNAAGQQWASTTTPANAGPVPIQFDFYQGDGPWAATLNVKDGAGNVYPVPASWLTSVYQPLPAGWSSSTPLQGSAAAYSSATVTASSVTLTDTSGAAHTYTATGNGGYAPPTGEAGVLVVDAAGVVTLTDDDGTVYTFTAQGRIATVASPTDLLKRATPVAAFDPVTGRAATLSDPLSGSGSSYSRQVVFVYQGDTVGAANGLTAADSDAGGQTACPIPSGPGGETFAAPPTGTLCRIVYPGHVPGAADTTRLFYNPQATVCPGAGTNGYDASCLQLAEILNPGGAAATFGYNAAGRLSQLRTPLQNDWLAKGRTASASNATTIAYDALGRVTTVTQAAPDGDTAAQPKKTYVYGSYADAAGGTTSPVPLGTATGTTTVDVAGVQTAPNADQHAATVTFDSSLRQLTATDAVGLTSRSFWNSRDGLLASVTADGTESTTVYDSQDRVTDSYGPAPASCFPAASMTVEGQQAPTGSCAPLGGAMPHSAKVYDGGLQGLDTQWFGTANLTGPVQAETVGIGTGDGSVNQTWSAAAVPAPGLNGGGSGVFSARLTGTITFPAAASYTFTAAADDSVALYVGDVRVLSGGATATSGTVTAAAGQVSRIRVDYGNAGGAGSLALSWAQNGGAASIVPGNRLSPNYSLVTSTASDDSAPTNSWGASSSQVPSALTSTNYGANPWLGLTASTTVDPTGLALTSTASYETTPGTGYGRQTSSARPAGSATTISSSYYGATQTVGAAWSVSAPICGVPASTPQFGMLRESTKPAASDGTAIATDYVYDLLGRVVGSKQTGDADWTCVVYDARGRVTSRTVPATATAPARGTVTTDYTAGGNPLAVAVTDGNLPSGSQTITTVTDLLGRVTSYTDANRAVTATAYDAAGEVLSSVTTLPSGASSTTSFAYDGAGRLVSQKVDSVTVATVTYDAATGLSTKVVYGNGTSLDTITRDAANRTTGNLWRFGDNTTWSDQQLLSQSGRVLADRTSDNGGAVQSSGFSYDGAGRLVSASIPGHTLSYGFGAATCGVAGAGKNGNRTSSSDAHTGYPTLSVSYCYDNADRLTGTMVSGAPANVTPLLAVNLTTSAPNASLVYDAHGNTTTLANQTIGYDSADRHTKTVETSSSGGSTTVEYTRDATDRIVAQKTTTGGTTTTTSYFYSGDGDTPDFTTTGTSTEHTVPLPGGVLASIAGSGQTWSYPNLHGDVVITANGSGARLGGVAAYDPFGDPIDPVTGNICTTTADDAQPANTGNTTSYGWEGSHQRITQHTGGMNITEMGARQYVPLLGRFLSVDPILGGTDNDYSYPNDPTNSKDLNGLKKKSKGKGWSSNTKQIAKALGVKEQEVRDAIHAAKPGLGIRGRGPSRNPDVEVYIGGGPGNGSVRIKGGNGDVEGNLGDYMRNRQRHGGLTINSKSSAQFLAGAAAIAGGIALFFVSGPLAPAFG